MRQSRRNPKLKLQNFRNLPSEIIIDIISRLPTRSIAICKCVCKSWRDLIRTRELLKNLPSEIVIEILSRLPIRTIGICKCVRKSWRDLIQTPAFTDSHIPKSVPGLVLCHDYITFHALAFEDELDLEDTERTYEPLTKFDCCELLISVSEIKGSVNGLLFLHPVSNDPYDYYICNPVTREYFQIEYNRRFSELDFNGTVNYGFGVSKVTGQYKVVRVVYFKRPTCQVYTLGTDKWRRVKPGRRLGENKYSTGAFFNGNLHWFVEGTNLISCFDLETETFSTFSHPDFSMWERRFQVLVALGDYLCICDSTSDNEIAFWFMKEYGDENSWTKEFVIEKIPRDIYTYGRPTGIVYPVRMFKDGHVLMSREYLNMCYYSNTTKTSRPIDEYFLFGTYCSGHPVQAVVYTPSFLSLKNFPKEYVIPM